VFAFRAAAAAADVGVLVLIEDPYGGTFRVREREMISSQGNVVLDAPTASFRFNAAEISSTSSITR
jgi:hypothetical protein